METKASNDNSQQPRETPFPRPCLYSVLVQEAEELPYTVSVSLALWLVNMAMAGEVGQEGKAQLRTARNVP